MGLPVSRGRQGRSHHGFRLSPNRDVTAARAFLRSKRPVLAACTLGCSAVMMLGWLMLK